MAGWDYINGYIERKSPSEYLGGITIEGIDLSPIQAQYFKRDDETWLWIKRKQLLEYDSHAMKYTKREREPRFEAYLKKQNNDGTFAYVGEFLFMRFKFKIVGVFDSLMENKKRLNLYVERLPMSEQTIINGINQRKQDKKNGK